MQSSSRLRLLWAVLFGLAAAGISLFFLQRTDRQPVAAPTAPIVVAARALDLGTVLTKEMLKLQDWPTTAPLPGSIRSLGDAVGKRLAVSLAVGQPVLANQVTPPDEVASGRKIPAGMRLITVPVDEFAAFGYRLRVGDRVDVLSTYRNTDGLHAQLVLQAVAVYAIGVETAGGRDPEPHSVTLLVTPQDGLRIALLTEEKSLRFMLRAASDLQNESPETVHRFKQP